MNVTLPPPLAKSSQTPKVLVPPVRPTLSVKRLHVRLACVLVLPLAELVLLMMSVCLDTTAKTKLELAPKNLLLVLTVPSLPTTMNVALVSPVGLLELVLLFGLSRKEHNVYKAQEMIVILDYIARTACAQKFLPPDLPVMPTRTALPSVIPALATVTLSERAPFALFPTPTLFRPVVLP